MPSRWDYSRLRSEGMSHEEAQAEMDRRANEAESYKQQAQNEMKQGYKKEPTTTVSSQKSVGRKKDEYDSDLRELERLLELRRQREEQATQSQHSIQSEATGQSQQLITTSSPDALDQEAFQHIMAAKLAAQPAASETPVPEPDDQLPQKSSCTGHYDFVYFIRHGNLYKLGSTANLLKCFAEIKPDEVLNVVRCLNPQDLASAFQGRFDDAKLLQTGYFLLSEQQIQDVHQLMSSLAQF